MKLSTDPRFDLYKRLYLGAVGFLAVVLAGALGYYALGDGRWEIVDCLYMTVITVSTVGFSEVLRGMNDVPMARVWTMVLVILGSGSLLYFASTITAIIIEGDLRGVLKRKRMQAKIERMKDHVVICGAGSTGVYLVDELATFREPFVVVDQDQARLDRVREELGISFAYVVGDATDDATLERAGIRQARGVLAALAGDKDNLFVTITARALNGAARIVAKGVEPSAEAKLKRAGADSVVSPNFIGGMRMAGEMIRPSVVEFFDRLMRDREMKLRIDELTISAESKALGMTLADSGIRDGGALVLCVREQDGRYAYNPSALYEIVPNTTLILIGQVDDLQRLRRTLA